MAKLAVVGLIGAFVAAIFALFDNSQSTTVLAVGLLLASIEVLVLDKMAGGLTPVVIPVLSVNFILLSSLLFWDRVRAEAQYGAKLMVTEEYLAQAAVIGIIFSAAYTVGALVAGPRSVHIGMQQLGDSIKELGSALRVPSGVLVAVGYAGIFLTIYAYRGAILRSQYQQANGPHWAVIIANSLSYVAMLALCIAAARPGAWRVIAILGIGIWGLILFGRGTRSIAALPSLILLGRASVSGWRIRRRYLAVVAVATVLLIQLAISTRANQEGVGIVPLAQSLTEPEKLFSGSSLYGTVGNFLVSGPLTAVVAHRQIPPQALWISVNPMPGGLAGWPEIQDSLRLNIYTPYNTLGELGAHGLVVLIAVAGSVGFALSLCTRVASSLRGAYAITATVFVLAVVTLYSASILQYNLRSTTRLVWYALFGVAAIWIAHRAFSPPLSESGHQDLTKNHDVPLGRHALKSAQRADASSD